MEFMFLRSLRILTGEGGFAMKLDSVGEIIATRNLALLKIEGIPSEVVVLLGRPQQLPDHTDFYCPYQVMGIGSEKVKYACGIDAFQALHLALSSLAVELDVLSKESNGRLRWDCDDRGDLGFPAIAL